jgi:hypothetical protein
MPVRPNLSSLRFAVGGTPRGGTTYLTNVLKALEEDETITASGTDDASSGIALAPKYNADDAATFTIDRHNYLELKQVVAANSGAGGLDVTDAAVMRFDAAAGTHLAVDSGTTKTSPGTVDAWVKVNINGTIYFLPGYTSKTT